MHLGRRLRIATSTSHHNEQRLCLAGCRRQLGLRCEKSSLREFDDLLVTTKRRRLSPSESHVPLARSTHGIRNITPRVPGRKKHYRRHHQLMHTARRQSIDGLLDRRLRQLQKAGLNGLPACGISDLGRQLEELRLTLDIARPVADQ